MGMFGVFFVVLRVLVVFSGFIFLGGTGGRAGRGMNVLFWQIVYNI